MNLIWLTLHSWIVNYWTVIWILLRINLWLDWIESESESESYVTTDGQSASLSWNKAPIWGLQPDFYYCQTVAGLLMWDALSDELTSCRLRLLLALASAVIFGSESRGTSDHILLYQIRDFHFRRKLRLAGLRWRYSTPLPHVNELNCQSYVTTDGQPANLPWNKAPIWGLRPHLDYCLTVAVLEISKSKSHCDWRSVSQQVLVSSPIWGPRPDIYYCVTVTVLFLWGALSDERTSLSFLCHKSVTKGHKSGQSKERRSWYPSALKTEALFSWNVGYTSTTLHGITSQKQCFS
jgi:hypothetical protein